jgi:hypothetical protein
MAMDENTLLGLLLVFVGASDVLIARLLADRLRLQPAIRSMLTFGGLALIVFGALVATRMIRIL